MIVTFKSFPFLPSVRRYISPLGEIPILLKRDFKLEKMDSSEKRLLIFLIFFIYSKIKSFRVSANFNIEKKEITSVKIILKTLGFTYLNAHVYSDTVFFLGNFSKNFLFDEKIYFGIGASVASFIFFFLLGYSSVYFSRYAQSDKTWKYINGFIISFMSLLTIYIIKETAYFL